MLAGLASAGHHVRMLLTTLKTPLIALAASSALVLSACGGKAPGDTITDMHAELCRTGDPATMANYVSKKSQPAMAMITAMMAEPEKAKQIKEKTGIAGYGLPAKTFDNTMHQFLHWVYTNDGQVIDDDGNIVRRLAVSPP